MLGVLGTGLGTQACIRAFPEVGDGMAILGCQLDDIRNELQSRDGGHPCDPDLEAG